MVRLLLSLAVVSSAFRRQQVFTQRTKWCLSPCKQMVQRATSYLQSSKFYFCGNRNGAQTPLILPWIQLASERLSAELCWGKFISYFLGKLSFLKVCPSSLHIIALFL